MTLRDISNNDDVIDSRDVIARIEELETELETAYEEYCDAKKEINEEPFTKAQWLETDGFPDVSELTVLQALQAEAEDCAPNWKYGAVLIRESYFTDYCEELCKDIGDLPQNIPAYLVIDWKKTADNIRVAYTEADFDGVTYLVR